MSCILQSKHASFLKMKTEFIMNANVRYWINYSLPLPWMAFMFYARNDFDEVSLEEGL